MIRLVCLVALLVWALPSDPTEQARLQATAARLVHNAMTYCDREPQTCAKASGYWAAFKDKAATGARMVMEIVHEARRPEPAPAFRLEPGGPRLPALDTLHEADRAPVWRQRPAGTL